MASAVREPVALGRHRPVHGFKRYYETLRERLWLVIGCVVLTTALSVAYVATAPRKYRATAEMLISPVPADTTALIGLPVLHSTSDPTRDVLTAASLMTTTQIPNAVVQAQHLHESPSTLLQNVQPTPI